MHRTVVLEHTLPDGTSHFDWMIEDPVLEGDRRLATWRTTHRPDRAEGSFVGERIGAQRSAYLTFEGVISGDRGSVRRLVSGTADWEVADAGRVTVRISWESGRITRYTGEKKDGSWWLFRPSRREGLDAGHGL